MKTVIAVLLLGVTSSFVHALDCFTGRHCNGSHTTMNCDSGATCYGVASKMSCISGATCYGVSSQMSCDSGASCHNIGNSMPHCSISSAGNCRLTTITDDVQAKIDQKIDAIRSKILTVPDVCFLHYGTTKEDNRLECLWDPDKMGIDKVGIDKEVKILNLVFNVKHFQCQLTAHMVTKCFDDHAEDIFHLTMGLLSQ